MSAVVNEDVKAYLLDRLKSFAEFVNVTTDEVLSCAKEVHDEINRDYRYFFSILGYRSNFEFCVNRIFEENYIPYKEVYAFEIRGEYYPTFIYAEDALVGAVITYSDDHVAYHTKFFYDIRGRRLRIYDICATTPALLMILTQKREVFGRCLRYLEEWLEKFKEPVGPRANFPYIRNFYELINKHKPEFEYPILNKACELAGVSITDPKVRYKLGTIKAPPDVTSKEFKFVYTFPPTLVNGNEVCGILLDYRGLFVIKYSKIEKDVGFFFATHIDMLAYDLAKFLDIMISLYSYNYIVCCKVYEIAKSMGL